MKKIRTLQIVSVLIISAIVAGILFLIQPSFYEAVLHILAAPTVVYILLTLFKPWLSKKLESLKTKQQQFLNLAQQREINRKKGLQPFHIEGHEIWASNLKNAMRIYRNRIEPEEQRNKGKLYYYMSQHINNL